MVDPSTANQLEYKYAYCDLILEGVKQQTRIRAYSTKTATKLNVAWNEMDFVLYVVEETC